VSAGNVTVHSLDWQSAGARDSSFCRNPAPVVKRCLSSPQDVGYVRAVTELPRASPPTRARMPDA
jgi:hypothetical protein